LLSFYSFIPYVLESAVVHLLCDAGSLRMLLMMTAEASAVVVMYAVQ